MSTNDSSLALNQNLDEKLKDLIKLREVQDNVITLRTEVPSIYWKYLKRELSYSMKSLVKAEKKMETRPLVPELEPLQIDEIKTKPDISYIELGEHAESIRKCMRYSKN